MERTHFKKLAPHLHKEAVKVTFVSPVLQTTPITLETIIFLLVFSFPQFPEYKDPKTLIHVTKGCSDPHMTTQILLPAPPLVSPVLAHGCLMLLLYSAGVSPETLVPTPPHNRHDNYGACHTHNPCWATTWSWSCWRDNTMWPHFTQVTPPLPWPQLIGSRVGTSFKNSPVKCKTTKWSPLDFSSGYKVIMLGHGKK